jgi:16S rRNA processing protein RimM
VAENSFPAVTLARILRPWGRRGDVAAQIFSDFPQRLARLRKAWLYDGKNPPRPIEIQSCRIHLGQAVFHFAGTDSINDAERLRGLEVQVPLTERVKLRSDRHYLTDLIGCAVWEANATEPLGTISEVEGGSTSAAANAPESWVLTVDTPRGEVLIPMAREICTRIDTHARRIDVQLPDGLRELNLRETNERPVAGRDEVNQHRSERSERRRNKWREKRLQKRAGQNPSSLSPGDQSSSQRSNAPDPEDVAASSAPKPTELV